MRCASTTRTRSYKDCSSIVIEPLNFIANSNALSLESFTGVTTEGQQGSCERHLRWRTGWSIVVQRSPAELTLEISRECGFLDQEIVKW